MDHFITCAKPVGRSLLIRQFLLFMLPQGLSFRFSLEFVMVGGNVLLLLSNEDLLNVSPQAEDTSD
jgi:hypothetical protein